MRPIAAGEILSKEEYERRRPEIRRNVMNLKARRRVPLGDNATVHFETRDTMYYQVHEMLRAEDSWQRPGAVEDELDAYNPLIPQGGALKATLMFEYQETEERSRCLEELRGVERHLWLEIGDSEPVLAVFDEVRVRPARISAVQYMIWPIDEHRLGLLQNDGAVVKIRVDHPKYRAVTVLGEETRREIAGDLD